MSPASPRALRTAVRPALLFAALVAAAYQAPVATTIDFSSPLAGALSTSGFHDAEAGYRWSRGRSEIRFEAPGATRTATLELVLSGFRPRGEPPPLLVVETPGETFRLNLTRRIETYALAVAPRGYFDTDFTVVLRSEVFSPGGGDDRGLGVRVHRAVLATRGWVVPPLKELLLAAALGLLLAFRGARASRVLFVGLLLALAFAAARHWAAMGLPLVVGWAAVAAAARKWLPRAHGFAADVLLGAPRVARASLPPLAHLAIVAGVGSAAMALAYLSVPAVDFDLGSGEVEPIATRFAGLDRDPRGGRFRTILPGGTLDLRDFGGGPWRVVVEASVAGESRSGVLVEAGSHEVRGELDGAWRTVAFDLPASSWAWRSGYVLRWPGLGGAPIRVASVRIERGRALPSWRVVWLTSLAALLGLAALSGTGAPRAPVLLVASGLAVVPALLVALRPAVATPFLATIVLGTLGAALLAPSARSLLLALSARGLAPELPPGALAAVVLGFLGWFLASASPLYAGGHFGYHTSIAEEIWQGKFLLYYLPVPENMLARQPQWGNLVVPHSSLFHTVSAPFAALPREAFPVATKLFLALLLAVVAGVAGLVATACGGPRAGVLGALVLAALPTGYQLLGLGHLMTIFGCAAAAVALGFLVLDAERLGEPPVFWGAASLLTLCFLSYTGSLLFGSAALTFAAALSFRTERLFSATLAKLLLVAWAGALVLYYGHWVLPFLTETLPALSAGGGSGDSAALASRVAAIPRKFSYSMGSLLVPVVGLLGLRAVTPASRRRRLLDGWALVLVVFTVVDLAFNLLLKHHYFSLPLVAVGVGLALHRLELRSRYARAFVIVVLAAIAVAGGHEALLVARGMSH